MTHSPTLPLSGRRALVTGGSRGIGAGIVRRLVADGADVAFTYSTSAGAADNLVAELSANGTKVVALQADSADADAVQAAVTETVQQLGGVDILVNNAGIASLAPLESLSLEEFDRMVAVNVRAVFVAIQAAVGHMTGGGRVITIGSVNGDSVPVAAGLSVYAMTKAAAQGFAAEAGMAVVFPDTSPRGDAVADVVRPPAHGSPPVDPSTVRAASGSHNRGGHPSTSSR